MYGLLITLAIVVALLITEKIVRDKNLNTKLFWELSFWTILIGILGARIYHILDFWNHYIKDPISMLYVWEGGLSIIGALLFSFAFIVLFLKKKGQPVKVWLDTAVISLPLAQAIGRWGNYFNKELIPYAIYESFANLALFLTLFLLNKRVREGNLFLIYIAGYSVIRIFLEPLRGSSWIDLGLNLNLIVPILSLIVTFFFLLKWKIKAKN